jgi:hypothetical protein
MLFKSRIALAGHNLDMWIRLLWKFWRLVTGLERSWRISLLMRKNSRETEDVLFWMSECFTLCWIKICLARVIGQVIWLLRFQISLEKCLEKKSMCEKENSIRKQTTQIQSNNCLSFLKVFLQRLCRKYKWSLACFTKFLACVKSCMYKFDAIMDAS